METFLGQMTVLTKAWVNLLKFVVDGEIGVDACVVCSEIVVIDIGGCCANDGSFCNGGVI